MNLLNDNSQVITHSLNNNELEESINKMLNSPCSKNMDEMIESLISTSLIVMINDYIHTEENLEPDGHFTLSKYDNIPLVKFENDKGEKILPVFTNTEYVNNLPYLDNYVALIVPAMQVLEMANVMRCKKMTINHGSKESIDLDNILIDSLVFNLIFNGDLSIQNTFSSLASL